MDNAKPIQIHRKPPLMNAQMDALNRRFALYRNGLTQRTVAAELGIAAATVSEVISGRKTSLPIARHVAEITGISINTLWPDGKYSHTEEQP